MKWNGTHRKDSREKHAPDYRRDYLVGFAVLHPPYQLQNRVGQLAENVTGLHIDV